ncbi:hypothetical protein TB2_002471 [Malus domestica]
MAEEDSIQLPTSYFKSSREARHRASRPCSLDLSHQSPEHIAYFPTHSQKHSQNLPSSSAMALCRPSSSVSNKLSFQPFSMATLLRSQAGKPFEDVRVHYTIGKELGRGQFGVTYLCTEISTGKKYACKLMNDKEDIKREIQIMQDLSGQPNIVEFKGCYEDKQSVHVCMELNSCQARRTATP